MFQFTGRGEARPAVPEPVGTPAEPAVAPTCPPVAQRRAFSMLASIRLPRRTPLLPTRNIKLPPGIVSAVGGAGPTAGADGQSHPQPVTMRRRNLPSQRSDNIHSMYVAVQDILRQSKAGGHPNETKPSPAKVQRRFSDPLADLPHGGDGPAL